jgi:hypothetical protein
LAGITLWGVNISWVLTPKIRGGEAWDRVRTTQGLVIPPVVAVIDEGGKIFLQISGYLA